MIPLLCHARLLLSKVSYAVKRIEDENNIEMRVDKGHKRLKKSFIKLYDPGKKKHISFRLLQEEDFPVESSQLNIESLNDPLCDDDCPTLVEQAKSSAREMNKTLKDAIKEYMENRCVVNNIIKYRSGK